MNRLLHNYFWGLLLFAMLMPIAGNAYNQTYDVKVGETFTVYTTYHSDITAILWTIPYDYVEPTSYIGPAATSAKFRAIKEIPSGVIIQAVTYTNYHRAGVDDWLVRITDDGSGGGEEGNDGSGGGEGSDDGPKYGDTFTSNVGGCEMTFYIINPKDKYVLVGDGVSPAIDTETTGSITIPSTINGYTIDGINNSAFSLCSKLNSISLPSTVHTIGRHSFYGCNGLETISLPNSIGSINFGAFRYCKGLRSIVIPSSVSLVEPCFQGCDSLKSLIVEEGNEVFDSRDNCNAIISKNGDVLIAGCKATEIPATVRVIGSFAFDEIKMKSVVIPDKVIDIRRYSFQSAGLKELIIGESVIGIGELAFGGCPLETITSLNPNPPSIDNAAFDAGVYSGAKLFVPTACVEKYSLAYDWNKFAIIREIGDNNMQDGETFYAETVEGAQLKYKVISATDKTCQVGTDEMSGIPASPNAVGKDIAGEITIPSIVNGLRVIRIGNSAFANAGKISNVVIPDGITDIGEIAFMNSKIKQVILPNSLVSISDRAFSYSSMTSVIIPDAVEVLGEQSFENCYSLQSVVIGNSLKSVSENTFGFCGILETVTLGKSITEIPLSAFWGCNQISTVYSYIENPMPIDKSLFNNPHSKVIGKLYVPVGTRQKYEALEGWNNFRYIIEFDPDGICDTKMDKGKGNSPIYSISGQRLTAPRKGINIVGRKKVIVK